MYEDATLFQKILLFLVGFPYAAIILYSCQMIDVKTNFEVPIWLQIILVIGGEVAIIVYAFSLS